MFPDNFFFSYLHIAANLISIGKVTKNNDTSKRISRKNSEITKYLHLFMRYRLFYRYKTTNIAPLIFHNERILAK